MPSRIAFTIAGRGRLMGAASGAIRGYRWGVVRRLACALCVAVLDNSWLYGLVNVATIYLPLLNEGTDCWRPVEAIELGSDLFRIVSQKPEDEEWPYRSGEVVRCRWRQFSEGEGWEAVAAASAAV